MNLLAFKSVRQGLSLKITTVALTLLACAFSTVQAAPPENYGISYTWVEGGISRHNDRAGGGNYDLDGGYLRGSFALGDHFYLLGGFSRNQSSVSHTRGAITAKYKTTIDQAEAGFGFYMPLAERLDFVAELLAQYLSYEYNLRQTIPTRGPRIKLSDNHNYAGKALVGLRAKPFDIIDVWGKIGYFKIQDADNAVFPIKRSPLANIGVQFNVTQNFGLVAEADFYKRDFRYYRAGVRVSF